MNVRSKSQLQHRAQHHTTRQLLSQLRITAPLCADPAVCAGVITEADAVAGKNKLTKVQIDIGAEDPIQVVTNAPNAKEGNRIVVATVGAIVGETVVKKTSVGGVASFGMLCDCPMLDWKGGAAGVAAVVPDSFALGSAPPQSRPRMDQ